VTAQLLIALLGAFLVLLAVVGAIAERFPPDWPWDERP
jgi:hypothetical protein